MKTEQGTVNEKNTKVEGERQKNRVQYRDPRAASREECALQAGSGAECEEAPSCGWVEDVVERVLLRPKRDVAGASAAEAEKRRGRASAAGAEERRGRAGAAGAEKRRGRASAAGAEERRGWASAAGAEERRGRASCCGRRESGPGELL